MSERAEAWIAVLGHDPDNDRALGKVIVFCPRCAAREFRMAASAAANYI